MATERDRLRVRYPGMADGGRAGAVRLFCLECMGGNRADAAHCKTSDCFLWPHAFRRTRQRG